MDETDKIKKQLSVCSFNCHGFKTEKRSSDTFKFTQNLLRAHTFLCIQEHWKYESKLKSVLGALDPGCNVVGCSPMDERVDRPGRPYGGCAIIWDSSVTFSAKEVITGTKNACAYSRE